jgi:hypothetical protein
MLYGRLSSQNSLQIGRGTAVIHPPFAADIAGRSGAGGEVARSAPIDLVVRHLRARSGEIRYLIMFQSRLINLSIASSYIRRSSSSSAGNELTALASPPEACPSFIGQAIGRNMFRFQLQRLAEIRHPDARVSPGTAKIRSSEIFGDAAWRSLDRITNGGGRMIPLETFQLRQVERLGPQAQASHSQIGPQIDQRVREYPTDSLRDSIRIRVAKGRDVERFRPVAETGLESDTTEFLLRNRAS